jgi:hypothetical protein
MDSAFGHADDDQSSVPRYNALIFVELHSATPRGCTPEAEQRLNKRRREGAQNRGSDGIPTLHYSSGVGVRRRAGRGVVWSRTGWSERRLAGSPLDRCADAPCSHLLGQLVSLEDVRCAWWPSWASSTYAVAGHCAAVDRGGPQERAVLARPTVLQSGTDHAVTTLLTCSIVLIEARQTHDHPVNIPRQEVLAP